MKKITNIIVSFANFFIFSIILFQQVNKKKTIIQEWNFDSNAQSNTGLECNWPDATDDKTVSGGAYMMNGNDGVNDGIGQGFISLGSINSGKLTYSITLKSWELSELASSFWDVVFYDAVGQVSKHKIITQYKTTDVNNIPDGQGGLVDEPYYATAVYTQYQGDNGDWSENFKVGKINNSYASAGNTGSPFAGLGIYSYNSGNLPVTINFRIDLDNDTYAVWTGDGEPSDDDGSLWGIYGGANSVNSGSIPNGFNRTIIKARTQFKIKDGASNSGNEFIEVDKISFYTGASTTASVSDANQFEFKFGPNPASSSLNVSAAEPIESIEFYSLVGQSVLSKSIGEKNALIDVSSLSSGVYTMKVIFKGGEGSYKLVVE